MKKLLSACLLIPLGIFLSSCATVRNLPMQQMPQIGKPICSIVGNNIIHIVSPGETLWRISKIYNVPIQDIMRVNNLEDSSKLEKNQQLVIPNISTIKAAIPMYPSCKWSYIIIHHSATDVGDAYYFNILHRKRGWNGIGYDFVIDNGTRGKRDGAIEVSPRWTNQENGAHCHAAEMNSKGIGICLVGNFSQEQVSEKQMDSLVYLANVLNKNYKIPMNNIMGHGQVSGAKTECPGKYFPWAEFRRKLESCR
jgi:murein DD-endopeptidase MepM/ murein hydrolase activator NlpD